MIGRMSSRGNSILVVMGATLVVALFALAIPRRIAEVLWRTSTVNHRLERREPKRLAEPHAADFTSTNAQNAFGMMQRGRGRGYGWGGRGGITTDRFGVPSWEIDSKFEKEVFTFVRIRYETTGSRGGWFIDYRDSELNFSLRLQQLTTLKVNPEPIVLDLTDPKIFDYPFIYIIEPGGLEFREAEVQALRKYCLNGGFLMVDDFWGEYEYQNFYREIKRAFPDREPEEVPLEHEIFHCVYDLKEKPQIPAIGVARRGSGITWEYRPESDTSIPYYKAIYDDHGRIMVFICHNTDLGDGWEQEAVDPYYFEEFSVKKAYPLGINIVTYAMTH